MSQASVLTAARRAVGDLIGRSYTESFFAEQAAGSKRSAEAIVPLVAGFLKPRSVVDVGCGVGTWLAVFAEHGAEDILGLDGDYVPRDRLAIPADRFQPADLSKPIQVDRKFDLAVSLEVGEHLPPVSSDDFVASLVGLSDVVLFSAAIPRQRGSNHVNERWQSWWAERFGAHGFVPVDCVRRRVWSDADVHWWYAQNTLLYVREAVLDDHPELKREYEVMGSNQLSIVHPGRYTKWRSRLHGLFT